MGSDLIMICDFTSLAIATLGKRADCFLLIVLLFFICVLSCVCVIVLLACVGLLSLILAVPSHIHLSI